MGTRKDDWQERRNWEQRIRDDERIRIKEREWAAGAPARKAAEEDKKRAEQERELDRRYAYVARFGRRNAFLLTFAKWTVGGIVWAIIAREAPPESLTLLVLGGPAIGAWRGISILRDVS